MKKVKMRKCSHPGCQKKVGDPKWPTCIDHHPDLCLACPEPRVHVNEDRYRK